MAVAPGGCPEGPQSLLCTPVRALLAAEHSISVSPCHRLPLIGKAGRPSSRLLMCGRTGGWRLCIYMQAVSDLRAQLKRGTLMPLLAHGRKVPEPGGIREGLPACDPDGCGPGPPGSAEAGAGIERALLCRRRIGV